MNKAPDLHDPAIHAALDRYWRTNLFIMLGLLCIWAGISFGCGILLADWFNQYRLPYTGFPLGFWFAQQGSIIVFVLCILVYCLAMNRLDRLWLLISRTARMRWARCWRLRENIRPEKSGVCSAAVGIAIAASVHRWVRRLPRMRTV